MKLNETNIRDPFVLTHDENITFTVREWANTAFDERPLFVEM